MAIVISFLGVGAVAIPTGIISAGFVEQYTHMQQEHAHRNALGTVSVTVDQDSPFVGQAVKVVEDRYDMDIIAMVRNSAVIVPADGSTILVGDILIYHV